MGIIRSNFVNPPGIENGGGGYTTSTIPATPLEPPDRSTSALSEFICVHPRPDVLFFRPNAKTKTPYWPRMNADELG
jgi:hypothetical protein